MAELCPFCGNNLKEDHGKWCCPICTIDRASETVFYELPSVEYELEPRGLFSTGSGTPRGIRSKFAAETKRILTALDIKDFFQEYSKHLYRLMHPFLRKYVPRKPLKVNQIVKLLEDISESEESEFALVRLYMARNWKVTTSMSYRQLAGVYLAQATGSRQFSWVASAYDYAKNHLQSAPSFTEPGEMIEHFINRKPEGVSLAYLALALVTIKKIPEGRLQSFSFYFDAYDYAKEHFQSAQVFTDPMLMIEFLVAHKAHNPTELALSTLTLSLDIVHKLPEGKYRDFAIYAGAYDYAIEEKAGVLRLLKQTCAEAYGRDLPSRDFLRTNMLKTLGKQNELRGSLEGERLIRWSRLFFRAAIEQLPSHRKSKVKPETPEAQRTIRRLYARHIFVCALQAYGIDALFRTKS